MLSIVCYEAFEKKDTILEPSLVVVVGGGGMYEETNIWFEYQKLWGVWLAVLLSPK